MPSALAVASSLLPGLNAASKSRPPAGGKACTSAPVSGFQIRATPRPPHREPAVLSAGEDHATLRAEDGALEPRGAEPVEPPAGGRGVGLDAVVPGEQEPRAVAAEDRRARLDPAADDRAGRHAHDPPDARGEQGGAQDVLDGGRPLPRRGLAREEEAERRV